MTHTSWLWVWGSVGLLVACGGEFTASDPGSSSGTSGDTSAASGVGSTGTGSGSTGSGAGGDAMETSSSSSTGNTSITATSTGSAGSGNGGSGGTSSATSGTTGGSVGQGGSIGGSAGRAGSGGSGGSGSVDAGADVGRDTGSADAGAPDVPSDPCPGLRADISVKLAAARVCNPNSPDKPCQTTVQDLCCPYPVAAADSLATNEYKVALQKFRDAHCAYGCTATLCPAGQGACMMAQGSPTGYSCAFTLVAMSGP